MLFYSISSFFFMKYAYYKFKSSYFYIFKFKLLKILGMLAAVEMVGKVFSIRTVWILFVTLVFSTFTVKYLFTLGFIILFTNFNYLFPLYKLFHLGLLPVMNKVHYDYPRDLFTFDMLNFAMLGFKMTVINNLKNKK